MNRNNQVFGYSSKEVPGAGYFFPATYNEQTKQWVINEENTNTLNL